MITVVPFLMILQDLRYAMILKQMKRFAVSVGMKHYLFYLLWKSMNPVALSLNKTDQQKYPELVLINKTK
jgi:hypothetical protein